MDSSQTRSITDRASLLEELDRLDNKINVSNNLDILLRTILDLIDNIHNLTGITDPILRRMQSIKTKIEEIQDNFSPIFCEIHGVEISIVSFLGKGKKRKFHGFINGNSIELNTGMLRVLKGLIQEHPNSYMKSPFDNKYFLVLQEYFPKNMLTSNYGKGCWFQSKDNNSPVNPCLMAIQKTESINIKIGKTNIKLIGKIRKGKRFKYVFSAVLPNKEKREAIFSGVELETFKKLLKNIGTPIQLNTYQKSKAFPIIKRLLGIKKIGIKKNSGHYLGDLKKEFRKKEKNTLHILKESEKIDVTVLGVRIQVVSKVGNGNYLKYSLLSSLFDEKIDFSQKDLETLQKLVNNIGRPQKFSNYEINKAFKKIQKLFRVDRITILRGAGYYLGELKIEQKIKETPLKIKVQKKPLSGNPEGELKKIEQVKIKIPLLFSLKTTQDETVEFKIDETDKLGFYTLKCNGQIIGKTFTLNQGELKILSEIISGDCSSINGHIKTKLENNTSLSIERGGEGKISLFIKGEIITPEKPILEIENGYDILLSGRRVIVQLSPEKNEYAFIQRKDAPELRKKISKKFYTLLISLIQENKEDFTFIDGYTGDIQTLTSLLQEIGIQNPIKSRKTSIKMEFRLNI